MAATNSNLQDLDDVPNNRDDEARIKNSFSKRNNIYKQPPLQEKNKQDIQESKSKDSENDNIENPEQENKTSQRLKKLRKRRRELYKKAASAKDKGSKATKQYRRIKRFIRTIKVASAVGTSLGDVFFSLSVLFLTINIEFIYSRINKKYPFDALDKFMLFAGWFIILSAAALVVGIFFFYAYIIENVSSLL